MPNAPIRNILNACFGWLLIFVCTGPPELRAQLPEFSMSDTTLSLCRGILYDSGGQAGLYGNNEHFTTVINPGGTITLTFIGIFNVENNLDQLAIYNGPNAGSPLIGVYSGTVPPGDLTITGGVVTLVFTSDNSAVYGGFGIQWETEVPPPIPPDLQVTSEPLCGDNEIQIGFSSPLQCDWLDNAEWEVKNDGETIPVTSVTPVCAGNMTSLVTLSLASPFSYNCAYTVELSIDIPDACEEPYHFDLSHTFDYSGCGIDATISSSNQTVCPGNCADIEIITEGCFTYSYNWNQGLPSSAGPHHVCPSQTTTYTVTVTETETGVTGIFSYTIGIDQSAILTPDLTICQSEPAIDLSEEVPGIWSGAGIQDEDIGLFEPDSADAGINVIYFESATCIDSIYITIIPISTDNITAACPGTAPFALHAQPAGGIWTGPHTTSSGIFNPTTEGTYTVIYTTAQCTDTLTVNVADIAGVTLLDSICQSIHTDTISFSPLGGYWEGPGIIDSLLGVYRPDRMPPGWVNLDYIMNGCDQEFTVFVKEIYIGPGFTSTCPSQDPMVFYEGDFAPHGGYWTGIGLLDTQTGLFDPSIVPNDYYAQILYYAPNGCTDTTVVYNRYTIIQEDEWSFCQSDEPLELIRDNVQHSPHYGGWWTGPGLSMPDDDYWLFSPATAGVGEHVLYYYKNECIDSMHVVVFPDQIANHNYELCNNAPPFQPDPNVQPGGTWTGSGITDALTGWFNPALAEEGEFYLYWSTEAGCTDSVYIVNELFQQAVIPPLATPFCYSSTEVPLNITPADAVITGPAEEGIFTPASAGSGSHTFIATWQGEYCSSSDTAQVYVYPPILSEISAGDSILCGGAGTLLTINATGGHPDLLYAYTWSDGGFPVSTHVYIPEESGYIYATTTDGCSDPSVDSLYVTILPPIEFEVSTSEINCYGEPGYASAFILSEGTYVITWNGVEGDTLWDIAGSSHELQIRETENGCEADSLVLIPNYLPVSAAFSFNPNLECIPFEDAAGASVIDLSQNATSGWWDFGNGNSEAYVPGDVPSPGYAEAGLYEVSLHVFNEGNCPDSAFASLCILPSAPLFIPDIFSPNSDGHNDILYVRSPMIVEMSFVVYDRWGEKVFSSSDPSTGWDGQYKGKPALSGSYFYHLRAKLTDGTEEEREGEIALIR